MIGSKFSGFETSVDYSHARDVSWRHPRGCSQRQHAQKSGIPSGGGDLNKMWSTVVVAGIAAAAAGKLFIGSSNSLAAIFAEAIAGGAVLALVSHAMIPEAIHDGGSMVVLPTVAGFLFALYLALSASFA